MSSKKDSEIPQSTTSGLDYKSFISVEDNIIKGPDVPLEPDPRGLGFYLYQSMKQNKDKIAQQSSDTGEEDTYSELLQRSVRTSINISHKGLTKSDIIYVCSSNHKNACVPYLASIFSGIIVACIDPILPLSDTEHILSLVKPKMIFVDQNRVDYIEKALNNVKLKAPLIVFGETQIHTPFDHFLGSAEGEDEFEPATPDDLSDTAVILFSSGTSGLPKGVLLSHYGLAFQPLMFLKGSAGEKNLVLLNYATLSWISSTVMSLTFIFRGRPRVISARFDVAKFWEIVQNYKVTTTLLSPYRASQIIKFGRPKNADISSLVYLIIGGAPMAEKMMNELKALLPGTWVVQGYGATEAAGTITCFPLNMLKKWSFLHNKSASCGVPIPGTYYKIVDTETEEVLGPNQEGELRIKSKAMFKGYYNIDSSAEFDTQGFLKLGDVLYYDEDFCFYFVDRLKDMLKYRYLTIAPAYLESILLQHPAVRQAVVIGLPHIEDCDHPMGLVINEEAVDVSEKDIEEYVNEKVSEEQKLRAGVRFINQIPMTTTGKIKRRELKQLLLSNQI